MELLEFLKQHHLQGNYSAELNPQFGYITFTNSDRSGEQKSFQLGLDVFLVTFNDILNNLSAFQRINTYEEKSWRDAGDRYFSHPAARSMCQVQTKPMFSILSKIIVWANQPKHNSVDTLKRIIIENEAVTETITKLDVLTIPYYNLNLNNNTEPDTDNNTKLTINKEISGVNTIYFGAPGTGKSYTIDKILSEIPEERKDRITFHPESDYSSFIGGYRPVSEIDPNGHEEIKYKFVSQIFTNIYVDAWNNLDNNYYLIIEEINRGNCAEIFGDLFQLLDRNSDYNITPSSDLKKHLDSVLVGNGRNGILNGKMKLPSNLSIYATMNTSDQSLFPMDSAFKRRWSWKYIPICYNENNESGKPNKSYNYVVTINENYTFNWIDFIKNINDIIKNNRNLGMDKCIGNYFIQPKEDDSNLIDLECFINKVIFYLWNDVFKDEENEVFPHDVTYEDFFPLNDNGKNNLLALLRNININLIDNQVLE